jgi:S-adenosylmethionine:tRNA ribosyltransferase-isomerase
VDASRGDGLWELAIETREPVLDWLERVGEVPLPPYIRRPDGPTADDRARYQTVFADARGAIAAPTAGLHLTPALLGALARRSSATARLTLHVGPATFLPPREDDVDRVQLGAERWVVPPETAARVEAARAAGGRVVAVGTTSVRALESAADADGRLRAGRGRDDALHPAGPPLRCVDALLTNFHLPRSPLLLLVAAWPAGTACAPPMRGGRAALPLLQLRRRDVPHVSFRFDVCARTRPGARSAA